MSTMLVSVAILLLLRVAQSAACDPPIFSFEGASTQDWAPGLPPVYGDSASQPNVYSMPEHATDGQYSLRVAFDYNSSWVKAVYYAANLDLDLSTYATLKFDVWKTGQPYSLTVALSTGDSWTWFESRIYNVNDSGMDLSIDLTSSDWKSEASEWVNSVTVDNLNAVHQMTVSFFPAAAGYNEAFLDNFRLCSATPATTGTSTGSTTGGPIKSDFVTTSGNIFLLNGCQYFIHGTNSYYITHAGNASVQNLFSDCVSMGLNVLRTWAFLDIGSLDRTTRSVDAYGARDGVYFQYWDSTTNATAYNDGPTGLQRLDYVVYQAKLHGVRLILSLTNNWEDYGGVDQYCEWFQQEYHDSFFTNENITQAYQNYAAHVINRVNVFTGVAYKDEPTILAWELMNEPRCDNGNFSTSGHCNTRMISDWIDQMSTYIHSIDPNHMISVGDEGFFDNITYNSGTNESDWLYDGSVGNYHLYTSNPYISFGTAHLWPFHWNQTDDWGSSWIAQHISDVSSKPFLLEEFGIADLSSRASVYDSWLSVIRGSTGAGFTYWMLASNMTASDYPDFDSFTVYNDDSGGANAIRNATAFYRYKETFCPVSGSSSSSTTGGSSTSGSVSLVTMIGPSSSTIASSTFSDTSTTISATSTAIKVLPCLYVSAVIFLF